MITGSDADARHEQIDSELLFSSLSHFQALQTACKNADPAAISLCLASATGAKPDGRFLVAGNLAAAFVANARLQGMRPGVDDAAIMVILAGLHEPLFDVATANRAAGGQFLLAYLRADIAAQFAITDEHGDGVLYALAELFAGLYRRDGGNPAGQRLQAISVQRMMRAAASKYPLILSAMCRRDPAEWRTVLEQAVGGDPDERFLLAAMISAGIVVDMGLEAHMGRVPRGGPQVEALLPVPAEVVVMDAATFGDRVEIARRFLCHYLGEDPRGQLALADEHGDALLHGLCEWATAVCPARDGHVH
jgi:hypothetical protein